MENDGLFTFYIINPHPKCDEPDDGDHKQERNSGGKVIMINDVYRFWLLPALVTKHLRGNALFTHTCNEKLSAQEKKKL